MALRKETIKQQFMEALPSALEPGEQVVTGSYTISGPSPLWTSGLLGLVGMLVFGVRWYFMAVTDRRVILMKASMLSARPKGLAFADPRGSVSISDVVTDAKLYSHLLYSRPGAAKPMRLNFHAWWRDEMKQIVAALGGTQPAPPTS